MLMRSRHAVSLDVCDISLIVPSPSRSWDEHESGVAAQEDLEQSQDGQV